MNNSFCLVLMAFFLLAGCVTESIPPTTVYTLSPERLDVYDLTFGQKNGVSIIKLATVLGSQELKGNEIIYTDSLFGRNSYVFSRWNESPVKLLQLLIQDSIDRSGLFKAVIPPSSIANANYLLESNLLDFSHHINEDGSSEAVIRMHIYLINSKTRTVMATKGFVSRKSATTRNAQGAVEALNKAAKNLSHNIVIWLSESGRF